MSISAGQLIPKLYYTVTPLFILLDYLWGINVRAVVLDSVPMYKGLYYGFCILCGVVIYIIPKFSPVVALVDSTVIFSMTVLSIFMSYVQSFVQIDDILDADLQYVNIVGPPCIINLLLVGGMAALTFRTSLSTLGMSGNEPASDDGYD